MHESHPMSVFSLLEGRRGYVQYSLVSHFTGNAFSSYRAVSASNDYVFRLSNASKKNLVHVRTGKKKTRKEQGQENQEGRKCTSAESVNGDGFVLP